ncbi:hypothetical protein GCK72_001037 [Caenorhabditis remanei]|uniref:ATP-dependent DNA helicase n=1 Tax=Caenorhabditis remanei TaxID=31234 RepID=A0A6A5HSN8_CAERE|nr:hypothetical protein GCK72_001037 [Caenorhabditis remanei]KAF1769223.1 hypothetical protein GCK72_001037 [Caenorhabditis remanei]
MSVTSTFPLFNAPTTPCLPQMVVLNITQQNIRNHYRSLLATIQEKPIYIYVYGPAGTGKTALFRALQEDTNEFFKFPKACLPMASTGTAALNVAGRTIHSALSIPINDEEAFSAPTPRMRKTLKITLEGVRVAFVDEISLVSSLLFHQMSAYMQLGRGGSAKPFGGISMVLFGDLLQLEPVTHGAVYEALPLEFKALRDASYPCVTENLWGLFRMMRLHKNVRVEEQEDAKHLNALREDEIPDETETFFKRFCRVRDTTHGGLFEELDELRASWPEKEFIMLAPQNETVDRLNEFRIARMPDSIKMRWLKVERNEAEKVEEWIETSRWARPLTLAPGCKVTLVTTIDKRRKLVNGAIGRIKKIYPNTLVIDFPEVNNVIMERSHFRIQKRDNDYFWFKQFPIREAEAMTIHNSQGRTVDGVVVYSRGLFMPGLMYTALSRARSLKLCRISHVEPENWKVAAHARDAVTQMRKRKAS